jgi:RNA polymerase sigma factor for flagellar operon FliA
MNTAVATVDRTNPSCLTEKCSAEERDRLILEHLPQVRMVARKICARLPENISQDDLVSTGILGLISAIDHFDPSRNVHLRTYAEHKIRGRILDSLRQLDWAPRQQRNHAKQIDAAIAAAGQRLHRSPTEQEVAAELNLTVDRYRQWRVNMRGLNLARLESATLGDSESRDLLRQISGDPKEWPSAVLERRELERVLAVAISEIPSIEKTVLSLYYRDELTLREIAKIVGLHESRVSQLKSQAILRLRVSMAKLWPASRQHPSPDGQPHAGKARAALIPSPVA